MTFLIMNEFSDIMVFHIIFYIDGLFYFYFILITGINKLEEKYTEVTTSYYRLSKY